MLRRLWRGWRGGAASDPESAFRRAVTYFENRQFDMVVALLEPLAERSPPHPEALNMLGLVIAREQGRFREAAVLVRRAVEGRPLFREARVNLGWILCESGEPDEGIACLDLLIEEDPADHEARLMRATAQLKLARFEAGWSDYESRHHSVTATPCPYDFPIWDGTPNPQKTLLVVAEQGIGDQIMFASCLGSLRPAVGKLLIECHPYLVPLLQRAFPQDKVGSRVPGCAVPDWTGGERIDAQLPIGSLPRFFRNAAGDFPRHGGYLSADPVRVAYWRARLRALGPGSKVGLSWKGGTATSRRSLRSLEPEMIEPLFGAGGYFINLQYGTTEAELLAFARLKAKGANFIHWPDALESYEETAALVVALDLVISVCTAVIHLAGALGQQVWILVPSAPEWRYLASGEVLPWYPSARLFRQKEPFAWDEVLERVARELDAHLSFSVRK